jgi:thiamine-phosphate pyrophosphorylase
MRRNPIDLSLYLVTDNTHSNLREFLNIVAQSIEGGVTVVQLRAKEASTRALIALGEALLAILRPLGIPLIINDRVDIAYAICADGVHLGQSDLNVATARAILGPQAIIGISVETLEHAILAQDEEIDYLAVGPLFPTLSKKDCGVLWRLEELNQVCALSRYPVIAIGGINETNIDSVMSSGVAGVAVISAIFRSPSPLNAAREFKKRIKQYATP